jgi:hypothetical protein
MMTREEYEQRKRRLEEQLAEGIELLRAGFRQQIRALDLVWMTTAAEDITLSAIPAAGMRREEPASSIRPSPEPQPAKPSRRPRLPAGKLWEDVDAVFDSLPQVFDRNDLLKALGYEPERSSLYRVVRELLRAGEIVVHTSPAGKIAAKYEKVGAAGESQTPAAADPGEAKPPAS